MLYKLENGILNSFEGKFFEYEGKIYANPTGEQLKSAGYKPLVDTPMPECDEKHCCIAVYEDTGENIIQSWKIEELAEDLFSEEIEEGLSE